MSEAPVKVSLGTRLAVSGLALVVSMFLLEAAARTRQYIKYGSGKNTVYSSLTDPVSGLVIATPGYQTRTIRINSLGFRSPELKIPKPAGTVRMAFLGSSTTFCAEVSSNEATWPHLVWKALQDTWPEVQFDYVNGAFVGYTVADSLRNLEHRVKALEPDLIIIYDGFNDLHKDARELARQQGLFKAASVENENFLARHSVAFQTIQTKALMIMRQNEAAHQKVPLKFDPAQLSRRFQDRLRRLVDASETVASAVVLVTVAQWARPEQPLNQQMRALQSLFFYNPWMSASGLMQGVAEYNGAVRRVAAETGTLLIEGADAVPGDGDHFNDSVHFKDAGAKALAQRVASNLVRSERLRSLVASKRAETGSAGFDPLNRRQPVSHKLLDPFKRQSEISSN